MMEQTILHEEAWKIIVLMAEGSRFRRSPAAAAPCHVGRNQRLISRLAESSLWGAGKSSSYGVHVHDVSAARVTLMQLRRIDTNSMLCSSAEPWLT